MARSESAVTAADEYHIEYAENAEEARLVVRTETVTVTVEGEPEEVHRQFVDYQAEALHLPSDALEEAVADLPMPDPDDLESVPADEFYGE